MPMNQNHSSAAIRSKDEKSVDFIDKRQKTLASQTSIRPSSTRGSHLIERMRGREMWMQEVLSLISSVAVIGITAGVLYLFDNRPFDSWRAPFSLNTFLSAAVSILYLLIMSSVTNCVLQLRWLHFQVRNPLADFQAFDNVAHGPLQSLLMLLSPLTSLASGNKPGRLWRSRDGVLINYAAFLVIVVAAIGPLTQLLLEQTTVNRSVASDAALPIASSFSDAPMTSDQTATDELSTWSDPYNAKALGAIFSGAFLSQRLNFSVPTKCSTGNCTWENYASFAVQSQVKNATSSVRLADNAQVRDMFTNALKATGAEPPKALAWLSDHPASAPLLSSQFIEDYVLKPDLNQTGVSGDTCRWDLRIFLMQSNWLESQLLSSQFLFNSTTYRLPIYYQDLSISGTATTTGLANTSIQYGKTAAWDTSFDIVLQPYKANVANGIFSENAAGSPIGLNGSSCTAAASNSLHADCAINLSWQGLTFPVWAGATNGLFVVLEEFLDGYVVTRNFTSHNAGINPGTNYIYNQSSTSIVSQFAYWLASGEARANVSSSQLRGFDPGFGIDGMLANVATTLTTWLRTTSSAATTAPGTVQRFTVIYVVKWVWMTVPVALILSSAGLLFLTALETRRQQVPVWTDGTLAIMVHGVDIQTREELAPLRVAERLEDAAKEVHVRFNGKELVREEAGRTEGASF